MYGRYKIVLTYMLLITIIWRNNTEGGTRVFVSTIIYEYLATVVARSAVFYLNQFLFYFFYIFFLWSNIIRLKYCQIYYFTTLGVTQKRAHVVFDDDKSVYTFWFPYIPIQMQSHLTCISIWKICIFIDPLSILEFFCFVFY